jgi:hypothetical protein
MRLAAIFGQSAAKMSRSSTHVHVSAAALDQRGLAIPPAPLAFCAGETHHFAGVLSEGDVGAGHGLTPRAARRAAADRAS